MSVPKNSAGVVMSPPSPLPYYAVAIGAQPGIYRLWSGKGGAEEQVKKWPHAVHRKFRTQDEAQRYIKTELFDKLEGMRPDSVAVVESANEENHAVPGNSVSQFEISPMLAARLEARQKYDLQQTSTTSLDEDVIMAEELAPKTEEL